MQVLVLFLLKNFGIQAAQFKVTLDTLNKYKQVAFFRVWSLEKDVNMFWYESWNPQ